MSNWKFDKERNDEEIWKDVPEWEGVYQESNLGGARSLDRLVLKNGMPYKNIKGRVLISNAKWYRIIAGSCNGVTKNLLIHRAVAGGYKWKYVTV